jgi:hypothetical protein
MLTMPVRYPQLVSAVIGAKQFRSSGDGRLTDPGAGALARGSFSVLAVSLSW